MGRTPTSDEVDALLAQEGWLRGLAMCLVHSPPDADDLVQEAWLAAARTPPTPGRALRPWLSQVLRNLVRMDVRGQTRRRAREVEASSLAAEAGASPEELLLRLELRTLIATFVKELDEPFRTVLLLRFFEGRLPSEIARAQDLPAGTVRWRIHEGLQRLRQRLDAEHGGRREGWRVLLLPLAAAPPRGKGVLAGRATGAGVAAKLGLLGVGAAGMAVVAVVVVLNRGTVTPRKPPAFPAASGPTARTSGGSETPTGEEQPMSKKTGTAAAFFGVTLPALLASAGDATRLTPEETIDFCIEMREAMVTCKELLADIRSSRVPAHLRDGTRRTILKEIVEDGTGPVEPRRVRCATDLKLPKALWISYITKSDVSTLRGCNVTDDCKMGIACWMNAVEPIVARSRQSQPGPRR